jgi:FKBP12-rapamycin complex-associated protein
MQRMTPDYDHLPLMNKVEVFEHALEHTEGDDLVLLNDIISYQFVIWRKTKIVWSLFFNIL